LLVFAVSGTVPEEPVVSKKSGLLFERRLIEKVVQETGRCPVTDEPLEKDDILPLSTSKAIKPRPTSATSIPGLLSLFQNEWDATVLEAHQLRQALHATRQELSHALYQHDAATRVIARLLRERDAYRSRLENAVLEAPAPSALQSNGKRAAETEAAVEEEGGAKKARPAFGSAVVEAMTACSSELSKKRKKRIVSDTVASPDDLVGYSLQGSYPIHATRKGGIFALSVSPDNDAIVASAGGDSTVQIFDHHAAQNVASLTGHSKKVMDVAFVGSQSLVASASADRTVRLWRQGGNVGEYECTAVMEDGAGDVVSVNVHPTNDYLITACADGTWSFYDVARSDCLARVRQDSGSDTFEAYSSAALHPDGLILVTGATSSGIKIWEARTQKCVASFDGHSGSISSLSFSENGYHMASAADDGIKVWDLRKLKNIKSLAPWGEGPKTAPATAVSFDYSGLFLAVGGADARVYGVKQDWEMVKSFDALPKKGVGALAWSNNARQLIVGATDHNLRVFGAASA